MLASLADPQVVSLMLESVGYPTEASQITFLAGHKVTTDPLAIPFSMVRSEYDTSASKLSSVGLKAHASFFATLFSNSSFAFAPPLLASLVRRAATSSASTPKNTSTQNQS